MFLIDLKILHYLESHFSYILSDGERALNGTVGESTANERSKTRLNGCF